METYTGGVVTTTPSVTDDFFDFKQGIGKSVSFKNEILGVATGNHKEVVDRFKKTVNIRF